MAVVADRGQVRERVIVVVNDVIDFVREVAAQVAKVAVTCQDATTSPPPISWETATTIGADPRLVPMRFASGCFSQLRASRFGTDLERHG